MNRKYTLHIISALILSIALVLCGCGGGEYIDDQALEEELVSYDRFDEMTDRIFHLV